MSFVERSWSRLKKSPAAVMFQRCGFVVKKVYFASPLLVCLLCLLTVLAALEPILTIWIGGQLIDNVVKYLKFASVPEQATVAFHWALIWIGLECAVGLLAIGLQQYNGYVSNRLSQEVTFHMRQEIYEHCVKLEYPFFESPASQDILMRCQNAGVRSVSGMFYNILRLAGMIMTIVASLAAMLKLFNWLLCVGAFAVALPNLWLNIRLAKERYDTFYSRSERTRWSGLYGWLLTMPWYAKDTILLGVGSHFYDKWKDAEAKTLKEDLSLAAKQNWIQTAMGWLSRLSSSAAYLYVTILTAAKGGSIGAITVNVGLFGRTQSQAQAFSDALAGLNNDAMFLEDYFQLMKAVPGAHGNGKPLPLAEEIRSIEFCDVSFSYPGVEIETLHNVSFKLTTGESLFMAGRNGAGKTSIIKLLLRLYEPTKGQILVNGRDIAQFPAASLRKSFSVLMQDYSKYPFTVKENIVIGDVDHEADEPRLAHAVNASKFSDILPKLPEGLESFVGKHFGGRGKLSGIDLSGGEWQKLGLARSFFRDSSVFILDEPTSNLDVQSESEVLSYFKEHVRDKLAIIVSHRLSAASIADRVLFVDGGRIVEDGRHADLVQGDGPYAALFRLQQDGFSFL